MANFLARRSFLGSRVRLASVTQIGFLRKPVSRTTAPKEIGNTLRIRAPEESSKSCEMFLGHEKQIVLTVFFSIVLTAAFFRQWVVTHSRGS